MSLLEYKLFVQLCFGFHVLVPIRLELMKVRSYSLYCSCFFKRPRIKLDSSSLTNLVFCLKCRVCSPVKLLLLSAVREEVAPGVALTAGGDHLLAQALTPQSRPGRVLVHLTAAPAPTHGPGLKTFLGQV